MALLPADELVQFTFIEKVTTTSTQMTTPGPSTSQTVGNPPNQTTINIPGTPSYPETTQNTTDVSVPGFLYIRQIVSLSVHINDAGNVQPSRTNVALADGNTKIVAANIASVLDDITD